MLQGDASCQDCLQSQGTATLAECTRMTKPSLTAARGRITLVGRKQENAPRREGWLGGFGANRPLWARGGGNDASRFSVLAALFYVIDPLRTSIPDGKDGAQSEKSGERNRSVGVVPAAPAGGPGGGARPGGNGGAPFVPARGAPA